MTKQALTFQQLILKLHQFWSDQGCIIWEPHNVQVGAGTGNPATFLRVLGPEPWRVAYVEPSIRPDDGRYGENPNRMQRFYQYQVILKPDPGNPQEIYLQSLEAVGLNPREHDIRFVEDNWESPALGAWGLGWEVWLDGQEITQFTYFQQSGGLDMNPVSVEITYGLERIALALQGKDSAWETEWTNNVSYHDMHFNEEVEHSRYYFDVANVDTLKQVYDHYEQEFTRALEGNALISAYDYVLKCSHLFNVLDTRGAIGVTERASYFKRMREMSRIVAKAYVNKREELEYPLLKMQDRWQLPPVPALPPIARTDFDKAADFVLEIGVEELPAQDVDYALAQLQTSAPAFFENLRLNYQNLETFATTRRLVIKASGLATHQTDNEFVAKGPPAERAFDANGQPTKAAIGFARGKGIEVDQLKIETIDGGEYVTGLVKEIGQPTIEVLAEHLADFIAALKFPKTMRWNASAVTFSRPIRWIVALYDDTVIPFLYADILSDRVSRGLRPFSSPELKIANAADYQNILAKASIILSLDARKQSIRQQIDQLAAEVGGRIPDDPGLMDEVANLVESPTALRGQYDADYLTLPRDVLVTVMRKHQRYFPVEDKNGALLPYFIAVRNGDDQHLDKVIKGNEHVLTARFSDARFFYQDDIKLSLAEHLPRLATLTFEEHLGSMLDKNQRVLGLVPAMAKLLSLKPADLKTAQQAAAILKADLATQMVVELTSLQGVMGREYALVEGQPSAVAQAIFEHWLPRSSGDSLPKSSAGILLALTDRLDSLVGLFGAGLAPKSTADPYGLRRAALGIIQILIHHKIDLDLNLALQEVAKAQPIPIDEALILQVQAFIRGRLDAWLQEEFDFRRDLIKAVIMEQAANPSAALQAIQELGTWVEHQDWELILDNFARCIRITRAGSQAYEINPDRLEEEAEKNLYTAYQKALKAIGDDTSINAFLKAFQVMVPSVQAFFDNVLVNTEDTDLRNNRYALLQAIGALQDGKADLSEMSGF